MKILYLSTARLPDEWAHGLQIFKTCQALAQSGAEVTLVAPRRARTSTQDPFEYYGTDKNFILRKLPCLDLFAGSKSRIFFYIRNMSFLVAVKALVRFGAYDAIYVREQFFISYLPREKTSLELHTVPESPSFWKQAKSIRRIVAISGGIKDDLVKRGVAEGAILVAPDAVDLAQFAHPQDKAAARMRLGLPLDKKIALYIGRLDSWKGVDAFFKAAALVPEVCFAAIGGEKNEIERYAKQYAQVKFLGSRPFTELADNQVAADVLVLPNTAKNDLSARYTSPLKLFTYMAADRPIVASDLPSIREVLDESTAVLVKPDSPETLAEGIKKVLSDESFARRVAHAARRKSRALYLAKPGKEHFGFYQRVEVRGVSCYSICT